MRRMFQMSIVTIIAVLSVFFSFAAVANHNYFYSDEASVKSEQSVITALTLWVVDNAHTRLTYDRANVIVRGVFEKSKQHNVDPVLVLSIIQTESGFHEKAKSSHGARGLMQVIPYWHRDKLKGRDPLTAGVNIEVGTRIITDCLDKFDNSTAKALNCYSGGGGKRYATKVANNHAKMRSSITAYLFEKEIPIQTVSSFQRPRMKADAIMVASK